MNYSLKHLLLAGIAMLAGTLAYAQVTTSSMNGRVTDEKGEPVVGATVVATHEPSGTVYGAIVNQNGQYTINGMRAGGPYKVEVSSVGYNSLLYKDVTLQLAETYNLSATLKESTEFLEQVVVIGTAKSKFSNERTGAATNIDNSQIAALPTVSRSITDVTRLSPYGGNGMSFAGADGRTANFTVDGANFNNNFGLSEKLPGGGSPISIDAIEEMQVVISPFDVRQTNFIGGGVNAITKSGTNTFKGTAYVYHKNENLRGDAIGGEQITGARAKDRTTTYGFTLGGPIVKNKLFFFVNYEYVNTPTIANRWRGSEDGKEDANNYISRTKLSDLQKVSDFVKDKYGYDTGSYTNFPADESNQKILARIDWNINDKNHLAVRYNYTLNRGWNAPNKTSMDGGTRASGARTSQYSMSFANSMYAIDNSVHSVSLDLNSRITDNLSNQFLATFSKLDDTRSTGSSEFPFIDILDGSGQNYMALGYELFSWNNAVHNTIANVRDDLTWYLGNHKVTGGLRYEYQMADNAYMRNGTGYYRYSSLDDFLNGAAPEIVNLTYGYNGEKNPAARVRFSQASIYAQDEWSVRENFKLTYGVRFDGLFFNNKDVVTNNAILKLNYYPKAKDFKETHIDTGKWPGAQLAISPRVGFNWDVFNNKSLKVRGGTGLFSGRLPLVFFTNMPTNSGSVQYQAQINANNAAKKGFTMAEFAGGLVKDANGKVTTNALYQKLLGLGYPANYKPEDGTVPSSISAVDSKFKMPQVWKTSLAVDYAIPTSFPFSVSVEGIFNKTINGVMISDWSMKDAGSYAKFNGVDNRPIYPDSFRNGTSAFVLENTNKGYGYSASATVNMTPIPEVNIMAAYTHTASKEITSMPGSNAESAFTYVPTVAGPNYIDLHNAINVIPDRFIASVTHNDHCGNHFSLIYETWRGSSNYSYMLSNDMNGDGYAYDAVYIPTDAQVKNGDFRFVSDDDRDRFMAFVHKDKYLSKHQGKYAEAYSVYSPWVHRVDFSYKHDFKVKAGKTTNILQLGFDIKNLLNLFNSNWGVMKILNPEIGTEARILKYEGADAEGYATFSTPKGITGNTKTFTPNHAIGQCWYASIGIKYMFN
ncbi:MAG: carboxypeptidase regulatory-like domain-containing protein [Bacteroidales bacterium]|nr:carboxypeptidase regulatory-like domain-containing protein [Bacteroidales bacterium]